MNYPFREAIIDYLVNDNAEDFMERVLTITENYPKEIVDALMNPLGTHDTVRIISRLSGEDAEGPEKSKEWQAGFFLSTEQKERCKRLLKIAAAIQYTLPGFPSVYYGDEVGMEGLKDPFNRQAFPWEILIWISSDSLKSSERYVQTIICSGMPSLFPYPERTAVSLMQRKRR